VAIQRETVIQIQQALQAVLLRKNAPLCFECCPYVSLSRACLGKKIVFSSLFIEMASQKDAFSLRVRPSSAARPCPTPSARCCAVPPCVSTKPVVGGERQNETRQPPKSFLPFLKRKRSWFHCVVCQDRLGTVICQDRLRTDKKRTCKASQTRSPERARRRSARETRRSLRKTAFLSHLYIKTIILPRQARDKHRESTQKKMPFFAPLVVGVLEQGCARCGLRKRQQTKQRRENGNGRDQFNLKTFWW
jgi:hypothetical protein